jgi:hypothetical protein
MIRPRLILTAALALAPLTASATVMRAVEFEEKVQNAAAIVVGECIGQRSQWDAARNWILTYSTFRIEKTLKGQPAQQITIVTPGGKVGEIAQDVIGVPQFQQGGEHVLFVKNSQAGPTVLYLEQGNYHVVDDGREKVVRPASTSVAMVKTGRGAAMASEQPRTLREFEGRVRDTMRRQDLQKMEMVLRQKKADSSILEQLRNNSILVALALIGAALATWQLYKRW